MEMRYDRGIRLIVSIMYIVQTVSNTDMFQLTSTNFVLVFTKRSTSVPRLYRQSSSDLLLLMLNRIISTSVIRCIAESRIPLRHISASTHISFDYRSKLKVFRQLRPVMFSSHRFTYMLLMFDWFLLQ